MSGRYQFTIYAPRDRYWLPDAAAVGRTLKSVISRAIFEPFRLSLRKHKRLDWPEGDWPPRRYRVTVEEIKQ